MVSRQETLNIKLLRIQLKIISRCRHVGINFLTQIPLQICIFVDIKVRHKLIVAQLLKFLHTLCCVHRRPPLDPNLNQIDQVRPLASHFFKIYFNNFLRFELVYMNIPASANAQKQD
jgi:hypothetical protein